MPIDYFDTVFHQARGVQSTLEAIPLREWQKVQQPWLRRKETQRNLPSSTLEDISIHIQQKDGQTKLPESTSTL